MKIKNLILVIVLSTVCTLSFANGSRFTNALKTCSVYSESGNVNTDGMNVRSTKKILGWQDGRCVYEEHINMMGINSVVSCKFNQSQIDELVSVTEAYELLYKDSKDPALESIEAAQNSPLVKVWNKYLQDTSVCNISSDAQ